MQDLSNYSRRARPGITALSGQYCRIAPVNWAADGAALEACFIRSGHDDIWRYISFGPFETLAEFRAVMEARDDWETLTIHSLSRKKPMGLISYMRIREDHGSAEVGCVLFSRELQRTREATEAVYLMARHLFDDLGYRRFEWKCDNRNEKSKAAARRFGFHSEGLFRQDLIVKGQNRDTAWFSMLDSEWPQARERFAAWLRPENFDADGQQKERLWAGVSF